MKTRQDPRFPGALKDWSHPADYLWPPSIHSWRVNQCSGLLTLISDELDDSSTGGGHGVKYLRAMIEDDPPMFSKEPKDIQDAFVFASGDKCRAYHPHIHGRPNHTLLLILKGAKRVVTWPADQRERLYPFMPGQLGRNDIGERNEIFMVDGFNVDLGAQPDLREVTGGLEGQAEVGDLMYVPCGLVHTLENVGDMLALGWLPTDEWLGSEEKKGGGLKARMAACPNANAYEGYRDGDHAV